MINPQKRAEMLRPLMLKDEKYLIPKLGGAKQEMDQKKLIGDFFRWKEYIGKHTPEEEEWKEDTLENVWSPKYVGLSEGFMTKPPELAKKLEFQNPAFSGAYALYGKDGDPRNYSKVFTAQGSGCSFDCNYCYVPPRINLANPEVGEYFSAKQIVDEFVRSRQDSKESMNVLRLSGGEITTIIPEMIIDISKELDKRMLEGSYLWIDTNLSTTKQLEAVENDLKRVLRKKNVGMTGCFKGFAEDEFSKITGAAPEFYQIQFDTAQLLMDMGTDFFVYVPALSYGSTEKNVRNFANRLQELNTNLPLRVEPLVIKMYTGARMNMKDKAKQGRPMPKNDQRQVFDVWFNGVLPDLYSEEMLNKYCCEVPL